MNAPKKSLPPWFVILLGLLAVVGFIVVAGFGLILFTCSRH